MSDETKSAMDKALKALSECKTGDTELDHMRADDALLKYLEETGAKEVADAFRDAGPFWYA